MVADLGSHRFEALAELVELDGETGEGERLLALAAVLGHYGVELRTPVESGPADFGVGCYSVEGEILAGGGELDAGLLHTGRTLVRHPALALAMSSVEALDEATVPCGFVAPAPRFGICGEAFGIGALGAKDLQERRLGAEVRAVLAYVGIGARRPGRRPSGSSRWRGVP